MEIKNSIDITGQVDILCRDATTKKVKHRRHVNNLVVQGGKDLFASAAAQIATEKVTHIELGENDPATPASLIQTALVSPHTPRVAVSETVNANPASIVFNNTFGAGVVVGDVGEAALYTNLTAGVMVARTTFSSIPKEANDELIVTWTILFG